jgi:hypothetical protein
VEAELPKQSVARRFSFSGTKGAPVMGRAAGRVDRRGGIELVMMTTMMACTAMFAMMLQAGLQRLQAEADPDRLFWLGNIQAAKMIRALGQPAPVSSPAPRAAVVSRLAWTPWQESSSAPPQSLEMMPQAIGAVMLQMRELMRLWSETTYPLEPRTYAETVTMQADAAGRTRAWHN